MHRWSVLWGVAVVRLLAAYLQSYTAAHVESLNISQRAPSQHAYIGGLSWVLNTQHDVVKFLEQLH